jgi:hypothetical protein
VSLAIVTSISPWIKVPLSVSKEVTIFKAGSQFRKVLVIHPMSEWRHTSVIPAPGRLKLEEHEFKANLHYIRY